jgi:hypothetical protein
VDSIVVKIDPIYTREGKAINALSVDETGVHSAGGPVFTHMGRSFFKEEFPRGTTTEIDRVGKKEWNRVMGIMNSINFEVVPKKSKVNNYGR